MADVALIHAKEDRDRAAALSQALAQRGFDVSSNHVDAAKSAVALWSSRALECEAVLRDAARTHAEGKLISIRIDASEPPQGIAPVLADLSAWPDEQSAPAFERLVQTIAALRGRPAKAAATRPNAKALMRGVLIGGAAAALAVTAVIAVQPMFEPAKPAVLPGPTPDFEGKAEEFTDVPGAADLYGLTEEEIAAATPRQLIEAALETSAIEAIEVGAARGDAFGKGLVCIAQFYGIGLPRDVEAARAACAAGAQADHPLSIYVLSLITRLGAPGYDATPADTAAADRLRARAAQLGDSRAQSDQAAAARARGAFDEAVADARRAADQNYAPADYLLGAMLEAGEASQDRRPDPQRAVQYYARAAQNGSTEAAGALALLYERGAEGVPRNAAEARRYYELASKAGNGEATRRLAGMLERGEGGEADLARARTLYQRAAEQGDAAARTELARLASN